ncbi:hypothetical protein C5167_039281 [Papaver somniferum]|uniref:Uncharacterized protein n=1 Tax=Papaver somniferum TaxID=3469 RepID=A0A4Y7IE59_PAPSO|nr:uncharacterized protein LOC113305045 [Papaver somniferum]RZC46336.1 hypothetical protein C5167_039281 [Papaver somniferum]
MKISNPSHHYSSSEKIPVRLLSSSKNASPDSDLHQGIAKNKLLGRKKIRNPGFNVKLKKDASTGKRSGPATPLLSWKFNDKKNVEEDNDTNKGDANLSKRCRRKVKSNGGGGTERDSSVSARKLAAGLLWQLQDVHGGQRRVAPKKSSDHLGFEGGVAHLPFHCHGDARSREFGAEKKDLLQSNVSFCGPKNGYLYKVNPSMSLKNSVMERATKWDPGYSKTSDEVYRFYGQMKLLEDQQIANVSVVSTLQAELEQARTRIDELENERRSSKKKLEHFLRKLADEKAAWRSREHEKVRAIIDDVKGELNRERKNRQRMELVNSKLVGELAEVKLSAKRYMQDYEKERKSRELMEEVCDELAKEIGEDKAEVEALKRDSMKIREEVDEERKMLQMAEVWREERVQMKLVDAKLTLEDKYSQLSKLILDLDAFLRMRCTTLDVMEMREAELLRGAASNLKIQDTKFSYEPPKSDDIFSIFEELQGEIMEKEIEPCQGYSPASHIHTMSPDANGYSRKSMSKYSNGSIDENGEVEEEDDDGSGWETVSPADELGSSYSQEGTDPSVNKIRRKSNVSAGGKEWEDNAGRETPDTEISEISSGSARRSIKKKGSSVARIWRSLPTNRDNCKTISVDGANGRLSNGRISNVGTISPDRGSGKGGISPRSSIGHSSSPDSANPHVTRGMKGCIEWPLGNQKNSLKAKLLEARMESQKIQLRQVLKQKI